jgi:apolipoprotein N-acyltransferase
MKNLLKTSLILATLLLSGCATFGFGVEKVPYVPPQPVKVITETVTLEIYQPPLPQEIRMEDVEFFVLSEKNFEEKKAEIEKMLGGEFVIFGLTPQAYENMAFNLQELRRYVRQQKEIILYYREATAPKDDPKDWAKENEKKQQEQIKSDSENNG